MKQQHLFKYRLFSAVFGTQQRKDDVIVTSLWILLLLFLIDFVPQYYHATFGFNWRTNKGETEGTRGASCPSPQRIWFQNTPA